jgi:hypothetical protein
VLARLSASPSISFTGPDGVQHTLVNHNKLVSQHLYPGANGMKTGFTNKAGHTLIATATRNGRTLIAVILNTYDAYGWAMRLLDTGYAIPPGHGTGLSLPPTRVTTYASRAAEFTAFERLSIGPAAGSAATAAPLPERAPTTVAVTSVPASTNLGTTLTASSVAGTKHGGGLSTKTLVLLVLVFLIGTLYLLRVRAVRRGRAKRLARQRATHSMMRRGSLPVVDGRYRTGTRVGKPVESHVQIRRGEETGDAEASG